MRELNPREIELAKRLGNLRFLVADASSSRKSFRKLLSHFGVKPAAVGVTTSFSESSDYIREHKPHVIIADQELENGSGIDLLKLQKELSTPGELRAFFLATAKDSNVVVSGAADESVDAVLIKPFTFETIQENFFRVLSDKLNPSPFAQALQEGQALFNQEKFEEAIAAFEKAKLLDAASPQPWACIGLTLLRLKRVDDAIRAYEEGLTRNPSHFRSLTGLLEALIQKGDTPRAYEIGRKVAAEHSVPPKYLPDLIRLSILNKKYDDLLAFYQYADGMSGLDPSITDSLAAGLVVCGLYFLQQKSLTGAMNAFRKAEAASPNNPRTRKRIFLAMLAHDLRNEAKTYLSRLPDEVRESTDVKVALFEMMNRNDSPEAVLAEGMRLIQEGIRNRSVYEILIRRSVETGRQGPALEELLNKAGEAFPEDIERFKSLLSSADGSTGST